MTRLLKEFPLAGVEKSCRLFGLTRDAFYKVEKRANMQCLQEALVLGEVCKIKEEQPKLGTEKIYSIIKPFLSEHGIKMGRDKLYDLLRAHQLLPKRKRRRPGTTQSRHKYFKYPNIVKDLEILRPNHAWKNDITYIRCGNGFNYLSLTTDAYSRKIIGWSLQPSLRAEGPIEALQMALKTIHKRGRHCWEKKDGLSPLPLIHHSDKGIQYCCREYVSLLEKNQIQISMATESYENPIAERVNGILKEELLRPGYPTHELAKADIQKAINIYNEKRPHRSLNMMKPVEAHTMTGPIPKRWKKNKYRDKAKSEKNATAEKKKITVINV